MTKILISTFFILFITSIQGCSDDSVASQEFVGAWVPYEIVFSDSVAKVGPFTGRSIFGFYAESLVLNNDNTYTPLVWENQANYSIRSGEGGDFQYDLNSNKIIFNETFSEMEDKMEFVVAKYASDELWLFTTDAPSFYTHPQALYKLKRVAL